MNLSATIEKPVISREKELVQWYLDLFPALAKYISRRGGNLEEARDIFQQSLLIFYEKQLMSGNKKTAEDVPAYIMGIAKHLWTKRFQQSVLFADQPADEMELPEEQTSTASENQLLRFLQKAGSRCLNLLRSFYYEKMNMEELASSFGFSTVRSATVQKYKCLEKVRDELRKNKMSYEDFAE